MNNVCIFDLDGVLINSRMIHYHDLNDALRDVAGESFTISMDEHTSLYDGLSTTKKLKMLTEKRGLSTLLYNEIWKKKQENTVFSYKIHIKEDKNLQSLFLKLKDNDIKIAVASNSIRKTILIALSRLGVLEYVDYVASNEDVKYPKPFPEMYWKCMTELQSVPSSTVILEDSHIGRQGAIDSGAHLIPIENTQDLTTSKINQVLEILQPDNQEKTFIPWKDSKLNVLIPMAGLGSRFSSAGYTFPKPLIEVRGKPMIQVVKNNLNIEANYIFLVQKSHYEKYNLKYLLNLIAPGCTIIQTDGLTEGAACTTLLAKDYINNENPLLIANSDQFVEWNSNEILYAFGAEGVDAGIVTFTGSHPKYSYAKLGENGFVSEVAEKKVISENATVGIYWFKHGSDYVKSAEQMISKNIRTNNEFYVAPAFNELIENGGKVRLKQVNNFWGIGTPEDLNYFLDNYTGEI